MSSAVTGPCALEGRVAQFPGWRCWSAHALSSSDSGRREEVSSNVGVECLGKESSEGVRGAPVVSAWAEAECQPSCLLPE